MGYLFAVVQSLFLRLEQREFYLYDVAAAAAATESDLSTTKTNGHANRGFLQVRYTEVQNHNVKQIRYTIMYSRTRT